jgi:hypothetical protein
MATAMAMTTYVQMVSQSELDGLRKTPASINKLDKPDSETFSTHYACCINYFVTGDAYPEEHALAAMLFGEDMIETSTLENGSFGVVSPAKVAKLATLLAKVDVGKLRTRVKKADWDELMDEEVDDAELLQESDDPVRELAGDFERLASFYGAAAEKKLGVAMYTA